MSGLSAAALKGQQLRFRRDVDEALGRLLLDSLAALEPQEIVEALEEHVTSQQEIWRQRIGEEEYRNSSGCFCSARLTASGGIT